MLKLILSVQKIITDDFYTVLFSDLHRLSALNLTGLGLFHARFQLKISCRWSYKTVVSLALYQPDSNFSCKNWGGKGWGGGVGGEAEFGEKKEVH